MAIILSLLAISLPSILPEKHMQIPFDTITRDSVYDHIEIGGTAKVEWIDFDRKHWRCTVNDEYEDSQCGFAMYWSEVPYSTIDFSVYEFLRLDLKYQGATERVGIFLGNKRDGIPLDEDVDPHKINSVYIASEEVQGLLDIRMSEFQVSEWWIEENNVPRSDAATQLDAVFSFEIDFGNMVKPGVHEYRLESIELVGNWIKPESIYLNTLLIWIGSALFYVISSAVASHKKAALAQQNLNIANAERREFHRRSLSDPLTGILNRPGVEEKIALILKEKSSLHGYCCYIIDVDFFKRINDNLGHDTGDLVLLEFSKIVRENLRSEDIFGRWGGDEFVLLTRENGEEQNLLFGKNILNKISEHVFFEGSNTKITASMGAASFYPAESFEQGFSRADKALYSAKDLCRNICIIAE